MASTSSKLLLSVTFMCHPLGFGVLPTEDKNHLIRISSIQNDELKKLGLSAGMVIHSVSTKEQIGRRRLLGLSHEDITTILKALTFPCTIRFVQPEDIPYLEDAPPEFRQDSYSSQQRNSRMRSPPKRQDDYKEEVPPRDKQSWRTSSSQPMEKVPPRPQSLQWKSKRRSRLTNRRPLQASRSDLPDPEEIIKLNVGGTKFLTRSSTLSNDLPPDSYFPTLLQNKNSQITDNSGYFFIDRSPEYFSAVLDILRTREWSCPPNLQPNRLRKELKFFQLEDLINSDDEDDEAPLNDDRIAGLIAEVPTQTHRGAISSILNWACQYTKALREIERCVFKAFRRKIKMGLDEINCRFLPSLEVIKETTKFDSKLESWEASVQDEYVQKEHNRLVNKKVKKLMQAKEKRGWFKQGRRKDQANNEIRKEASRLVNEEWDVDSFISSLARPLVAVADPPGDVLDDQIYLAVKQLCHENALNVEKYLYAKHKLSVEFDSDRRLVCHYNPEEASAGWLITKVHNIASQDGTLDVFTITWTRSPLLLA